MSSPDTLPSDTNFGPLTFWERHRGTIARDIWPLFNFGDWTSLAEAKDKTQPLIPGMHGKLAAMFEEAQFADLPAQLEPKLRRIGLFDECLFDKSDCDEFELHAAKLAPTIVRGGLLRELLDHGLRPGRIVLITGQRPCTVFEDGNLADFYMLIDEQCPQLFDDPWVAKQWQLDTPFATQAELSVLAMLIAWAGLARVDEDRIEKADTMLDPRGLEPKRAFASLPIVLPDGQEILVINCPGIVTAKGVQGPNTVSCAKHRMRAYPPKAGATIVVLQGKTHWYRILCELEQVLHAIDPTVTIRGYALATTEEEALQRLWINALGELFRMLKIVYEARIATAN